MLSVQGLWAGSFRIGIAGDLSSPYAGILEGVFSVIGKVYDPQELEKTAKREAEEKEALFLREREKALLNEDFTQLDKVYSPKEDIVQEAEIEVCRLSPTEIEASYLRKGDKDAVAWTKASGKLDALLFVEAVDDNGFAYVTLSLDGEKVRDAWYIPALRESEEKALLEYFSSLYLGDEHHLQKIEVVPSSASIRDNGESMESSGYVVLADGTHDFSLSAYGYQDLRTVIETNSAGVLSFQLEPASPHSLYINAYPWDAEVVLNGRTIGGKSVDGVFSPYTLTMTREGFSLLSYQTTSARESVSLSMKPAWSDEVDLVREKKGDFYEALFTTLASYGGFVATKALNNYSEHNVKPLMVVLGGASIVSLVNLVQCAADYFSAAALGL